MYIWVLASLLNTNTMKHNLLFIIAFCFATSQFAIAQNSKQTVATNWLIQNREILQIQDAHTLEMLFSKVGLSGETFRYYQMQNGVQVFDAEITIHVSNNNVVTYYASTYDASVETINTIPQITQNEAFEIAKNEINAGEIAFKKEELFIYNKRETTILAYIVRLEPKQTPIGSWEIIVNAETGTVINVENKALNHKDKNKKKEEPKAKSSNMMMLVNGSGFVFETDPLTATNNVYGGQYVDNNDATNAALDAARTNVTLLDITQTGGQYYLEGPYAEVVDFESPSKGLFNQASSVFNFNRQQDGFEAVNVYYHIDKSMRYINETLGINLMPYQYTTGVKVDPSGLNGSDNSHYLGGSGSLSFGEGCVDDAEDADVVLHELGHGLHDWLTNGGLSQVNGLSEGCGDYWANSYKRSLGQWNTTDASYYYVFGWDGHNTCWNGRVTNYGAQYPSGLIGQIHTDGQMWATTLMEIWEDIGREKTDKAFLEGLAMTNSGTNQQNAAIAVRQAAIDMGTAHGYTCADIQAMTNRFTAQGYNMPAYNCNLSVDEFNLNTVAIYPNPTNGLISFKNLKEEQVATIYNMLGQKVKTQSVNSTTNSIDVSSLATGTYFIKFNGVGAVLKFIKE